MVFLSPVAEARRQPNSLDDWTDFDSKSFKGNIKQRRKKKTSRDLEEQGRLNHSDFPDDAPSVTPSWMNKPVNSDASWMPIAAPPPIENSGRGVNSDASWIPIAAPTPSENSVRGDDASRDGSESGVPQSPAERRRTARQHQALQSPQHQTTERGRATTLPSPSSQRTGRSQISRGDGLAARDDDNDNPMRGRCSSRGSAESSRERQRSNSRQRSESPRERQRSNSRQRSESPREHQRSNSRQRSDQKPAARERSSTSTPSGRGRSGSRNPVSRERSSSRTSTQRLPSRPATAAGGSHSVGPGLPRPTAAEGSHSVGPGLSRPASRPSIARNPSTRTLDANIGRDVSFGRTVPKQCTLTPQSGRKDGGLMQKLFGDHREIESRSLSSGTAGFQLPFRIHSRILLTATVYHNAATNLWITTINTNQRGVATNPVTASKYLKAFSFASQKEARESAIANAPPKMLPFSESSNCFICNGNFAVFRRPCHCRNCGVCVCSGCTMTWPSKMIPETYNLKNEKHVNICASCDGLSESFKTALLKGDSEMTVALYGTGNINLRTPFPAGKKDKKGETMHPIHCAVEGGKLNIVRWLLEERYCPVKKVASGNSRKKRGIDIPILTSKGRSVLNIAMTSLQVEVLRYLVVDKSVSVFEIKDLALSLRALEAVLVAVPAPAASLQTSDNVARWADEGYDVASYISGSYLGPAAQNDDSTTASRNTKNLADTTCIICYDNTIDCVITPCGHQICCLVCAENMSNCPVCNTSCEFIRIFKP